MEHRIQVEPGVKLFVQDLNPGGRKTILFLHGWPLNHMQFDYQYNVLPEAGYRVIGVDWRGYGKSDKPLDGYSFDRLAADIRAVVDALGLKQFTLAGHSTGGAIAVRYAARYGGHEAANLVLIDAAAPRGFTPETAERMMAGVLNDRPKMMRDVAELFFFQYVSMPFNQWFINLGLEAPGWSTAAIIRTLRDERLDADLAKIDIPTLIVHGVQDRVVPYSQAEELQRGIKRSMLVPFNYSGHAPFYEERDKFNRLMMDFVG